jgi:hypothetical protein
MSFLANSASVTFTASGPTKKPALMFAEKPKAGPRKTVQLGSVTLP